jgi:hypothetical protein
LHVATALLFAILMTVHVFGQKPGALRIVVLTGEDAVNIVQQGTAVAPVVEVRDRNDQPVAGAVVRFAIRGGRATFGGPRALTVTTNAAGRAAVSTLTPTAPGVVQITATASFQGQTIAVTIAQTNLVSAAAAGAGAGASGGTAATAGGAAGGSGGGGLSGTTIAIVSGAAVGGAVATKTLLFDGTRYEGDIAGDVIETLPGSNCTSTYRYTGRLILQMHGDPDVSGTADKDGEASIVMATTCLGARVGRTDRWGWLGEPRLQGTTQAIRFHAEEIGANYGAYFDFFGSLENGVITGTLTVRNTDAPSAGGAVRGVGVIPVVLR